MDNVVKSISLETLSLCFAGLMGVNNVEAADVESDGFCTAGVTDFTTAEIGADFRVVMREPGAATSLLAAPSGGNSPDSANPGGVEGVIALIGFTSSFLGSLLLVGFGEP